MASEGRDGWPDPLDGPAAAEQDAQPRHEPHGDAEAAGTDYRRRLWRVIWITVGVAVLVRGGIGVWALVSTDEVTAGAATYFVSSSAFFIAVPAVLAWALARRGPRETAMGRVMVGTTIALLLVSMVLGEGALCVLIAAPLVYAVAAGVVAIRSRLDGSSGQFLAVLLFVPLLQPGAAEQVHVVEVQRVVEADIVEVRRAIEGGPDFSRSDRPWLLTVGYPAPAEAHRSVQDGRTLWSFAYGHGASTFELLHEEDGYEFAVVEDAAMRRWFAWQDSSVELQEVERGTEVIMRLRFDPALGPDWYFGTIERQFMSAAGTHLMDALGLTEVDR